MPLFAAKESPFAKYHANQGLVLFILEVILCIVSLNVISVILAIAARRRRPSFSA